MTVNKTNSCDLVTQPIIEQKEYFDFKLLLEHCSQDYKDIFYGQLQTQQEGSTAVNPKTLPAYIRKSWKTLNLVLETGNLNGLTARKVEQLLEASSYFQITWVKKEAIQQLVATTPSKESQIRLLSLAQNSSCPEILHHLLRDNPQLLNHKKFPQEFFNYFDFMRQLVIDYPPAVLLVGETLKEDTKAYRVLFMEAISSLIVNSHPQATVDKAQEVHDLAKKVFPKDGLDVRRDIEFTTLTKVLLSVHDWVKRPTEEELKTTRNKIWDGILQVSYPQFIEIATQLTTRQVWSDLSSIQLILMMATVTLARTLDPIEAQPLSRAFVAFNPTDKALFHWATSVSNIAFAAADASLQNDPELQCRYINQIKTDALFDRACIKSPYFPKVLYDDLDFMKKVLGRDPSLISYLGEKLQLQREELLIYAITEKCSEALKFLTYQWFTDQGELLVQSDPLAGIPWSQFKHEAITAGGISTLDPLYNQLIHRKYPLPMLQHLAGFYTNIENIYQKIFSNIGENFLISEDNAVYLASILSKLFPKGEFEKIIVNKITNGMAYKQLSANADINTLTQYTSELFVQSFFGAIEHSGTLIDELILGHALSHTESVQSDALFQELFNDLDFMTKLLEENPSLHTYAGTKLRLEKSAEFEKAIVDAVVSYFQRALQRAKDRKFTDEGEFVLKEWYSQEYRNVVDLWHTMLTNCGLEQNERLKKPHLADVWCVLEGHLKKDSHSAELRKKIFTYLDKNFVIGDSDQAKLLTLTPNLQ